MEIKGKVTQVLPVVQGTSASTGKQWAKQGVVIETLGQYPRKVYCTLFNDRIEQNKCEVGQLVTAQIDIESREFNGKWYTDINAWAIKADAQPQPVVQAPAAPSEDLPFF